MRTKKKDAIIATNRTRTRNNQNVFIIIIKIS